MPVELLSDLKSKSIDFSSVSLDELGSMQEPALDEAMVDAVNRAKTGDFVQEQR